MSAAHTERFVVAPDGVRLFVREFGGGSAGTPVFCLHGLTRNSADFEGVAPFIEQSGRRVLAMDVRGRGRSDRDADFSRYRPDIYAKDVLQVLDALHIDRAVFVGTSMGGLIAMILASLAPERIAGAVLNDVGPVLDPAGLARIAGYVGNIGPYASWDDLTKAMCATQSIAFPEAKDDFWRTFAKRVGRQLSDGRVIFDYDPAIALAFAQPAGAVPPDLQALFAALSARPVPVLRGALSDILAPEGVDAMRMLNPRLKAVEVPGVGHAPTLDEPVARFAILEFLRDL